MASTAQMLHDTIVDARRQDEEAKEEKLRRNRERRDPRRMAASTVRIFHPDTPADSVKMLLSIIFMMFVAIQIVRRTDLGLPYQLLSIVAAIGLTFGVFWWQRHQLAAWNPVVRVRYFADNYASKIGLMVFGAVMFFLVHPGDDSFPQLIKADRWIGLASGVTMTLLAFAAGTVVSRSAYRGLVRKNSKTISLILAALLLVVLGGAAIFYVFPTFMRVASNNPTATTKVVGLIVDIALFVIYFQWSENRKGDAAAETGDVEELDQYMDENPVSPTETDPTAQHVGTQPSDFATESTPAATPTSEEQEQYAVPIPQSRPPVTPTTSETFQDEQVWRIPSAEEEVERIHASVKANQSASSEWGYSDDDQPAFLQGSAVSVDDEQAYDPYAAEPPSDTPDEPEAIVSHHDPLGLWGGSFSGTSRP